MSKDSEGSRERISELEGEVERLKARLQDKEVEEADAGAVEAVRREGLTADDNDAAAAEAFAPSRSRLIILGLLAGLLALGGVLLITTMLSSGFNVLGKKVAATVYPDDPGATQPKGETKQPAPPKKAPPKKEEDPAVEFRPPGL